MIRWTRLRSIADAESSVGGGGYLASEDSRFVIFARRHRAGMKGSRVYHRVFATVEYIGGASGRTGGAHRTLIETSNLDKAKQAAEKAAETHAADYSLRMEAESAGRSRKHLRRLRGERSMNVYIVSRGDTYVSTEAAMSEAEAIEKASHSKKVPIEGLRARSV